MPSARCFSIDYVNLKASTYFGNFLFSTFRNILNQSDFLQVSLFVKTFVSEIVRGISSEKRTILHQISFFMVVSVMSAHQTKFSIKADSYLQNRHVFKPPCPFYCVPTMPQGWVTQTTQPQIHYIFPLF